MASAFQHHHMDKYRDIWPWATDQYWLGSEDYGFKGLVTTDMLFDQDSSTVMALRNDGDTAYRSLRLAHIYGPLAETPAHLTIGDAGTTQHSLDSEDDLMVTGELEVKGATFFDGAILISPTGAGTWLDFALETEWVSGTLIRADFASSTTLTNDAIGMMLDFNTQVTMTVDKDVTVFQVKLPALTSSTNVTTNIIGYDLPTAGALNQSAAGAIVWKGVNIQMPNIAETTGTTDSFGLYITGGTVTSGSQYGILMGDNVILALGTGADQVMLNRSATLTANTALGDVLIGTPVAQALAANTLMISNITSGGDLVMYVNVGGHSQMVLWADGVGDTAVMAASGKSVDTYINGTKEIDYATGAMAFQQATTISTTTGDLTIDPTASLNVTLTDDDADALDIANTGASYYLIKTTNTVAGTIAHTFDTEDAVIASGTTNIYSLATFPAYTLTYTTTTAVTSLIPTVVFGSTTLTHASALAVTKATTIQVAPPIEGTLTLATSSAIRILNAASGTPTTQVGLYIEDLTAGATYDYGIYIAGADTAAIYIASSDPIQFGAANDIIFPANTAASLELSDGTTKYYTINTQTGTVAVFGHTIDVSDPTITSAAGAVYGMAKFNAYTLNYGGATQVTTELVNIDLQAVSLVSDTATLTVDDATTLKVVAPTESTQTIITEARAIHIVNCAGTPVTQYGIYIDALTSGATADYAIYTNGGLVHFGGNMFMDDAAGPIIVNEAATSTNPTLCPNRAEDDTGIGWTSTDTINIVLGGANEFAFSTTTLDLKNNTLTNIGAANTQITGTVFTWAAGGQMVTTGNNTLTIGTPSGTGDLDLKVNATTMVLLDQSEGDVVVTAGLVLAAATAPATGDSCWLVHDNSGDVTLNVRNGKAFHIAENGTDEYDFTDTALAMNGNNITGLGSLAMSGDLKIADGYGLIVGSATIQVATDITAEAQVIGTTQADSSLLLAAFSETNGVYPSLQLLKSGHATVGSNTTVADNELLGAIEWLGADGTDLGTVVASIFIEVNDATPAAGDIGADMVFKVMPGGAGSYAETFRLYAGGGYGLNTSYGFHTISDSGNEILYARPIAANAKGTFIMSPNGTFASNNQSVIQLWMLDVTVGANFTNYDLLELSAGSTSASSTDFCIIAAAGGTATPRSLKLGAMRTTDGTGATATWQLAMGVEPAINADIYTKFYKDLIVASGQKVRFGDTNHLGWDFELNKDSTSYSMGAFVWSSSETSHSGQLIFGRGRGTQASPAAATNGDDIGKIAATILDASGTPTIRSCATILFQVDGVVGAQDTPGRIIFQTVPDGSSTLAESFRVDNTGSIVMADTKSIQTGVADDDYFLIKADDTGVGVVEVARAQGAADPYFSMGASQEFKFYTSGDALVTLDKKLMFGDTAVYIFSDDDGYLDLVADGGVRISGLTSGRVAFVSTAGLLVDDADFTFSVDTLTVTKIGAFQATGAIDFNSQALTNLDINSGTIAGVTVDGDLTWSSAQTGVTLTSPTINGTIATTGLTLPAITLGGAVAGGGQSISALANITGMTGYLELTEMAAPGAGAANTARIYALEGAGDAFTDLCAVFQDGSIDVFAQESTPPDSPIFRYPDNTPISMTMRKPDDKTIQFVATFPDGTEFVMREKRYTVAR